MRTRFLLLDVFTSVPFSGNQLAVFPDASHLSETTMQALAREFNFSETTFVVPPTAPDANARVRIFTPRREVQFAGHPLIGTAVAIAERHRGSAFCRVQLHLETQGGALGASVETAGTPHATIELTRRLETESPAHVDTVAAVLTVSPTSIMNVRHASVGLPFCLVQLESRDVVDAARLDRAKWNDSFANLWSPNLFFYSGDPLSGDDLYARMIGPDVGIDEDPATGSACAALAASLALESSESLGRVRVRAHQGVAMGRPSLIEATAIPVGDGRAFIQLGGNAVVVGEGEIVVIPRSRPRLDRYD